MKIVFVCETFRKDQPQITYSPSHLASSVSKAAEVEFSSILRVQHTHLRNSRIDCYCVDCVDRHTASFNQIYSESDIKCFRELQRLDSNTNVRQ